MKYFLASLFLVVGLTACGGGGASVDDDYSAETGKGTGTGTGTGTESSPAAIALAQVCAADNPWVADALDPTVAGSLSDEQRWVKAYLTERYLWYRDMPTVDGDELRYWPSEGTAGENFLSGIQSYFSDLLTPNLTPSGTRVDRFSFLTSTASWASRVSGGESGYGWILQGSGSGATRQLQVAYVYPTSSTGTAPARGAGIARGDRIISIDGDATDTTDADAFSRIIAALSPAEGESHTFVIQDAWGQTREVTLTAKTVVVAQAEHRLVTDTTSGMQWGYLLFNSHVDSAQAPLLAALSDFQRANIGALVVDLRYNSGGYLAMASALAYGVAGPAKTFGKTFEALRYNDKRSAENDNMPFYTTDFDGRNVTALNLSKVYVLTSPGTCSASESFINGLRGIDVEVVQIGGTTCGKPYGFVAQDNCGITYAAMEFEGVNDKGQGSYSDGFVPQCAASDDLTHALGDPEESMFSVAMAHHRGQSCVSPAAVRALASGSLSGMGKPSTQLIRPEWLGGKVLRPALRKGAARAAP